MSGSRRFRGDRRPEACAAGAATRTLPDIDVDIDDRGWKVMLLAWLLGLVFIVATTAVRYAAQWYLCPEEAAMFLQDTLWRETSREQRRINRWIAWARRRQQRKADL